MERAAGSFCSRRAATGNTGAAAAGSGSAEQGTASGTAGWGRRCQQWCTGRTAGASPKG